MSFLTEVFFVTEWLVRGINLEPRSHAPVQVNPTCKGAAAFRVVQVRGGS